MFKNKPWTIKVIFSLLIFRLTMIALIIVTFGFVKDIDPDSRTAGAAIRNGIVNRFGLDMSDASMALGTLIGANLIPILVTLFIIHFISNRKNTPSIVVLIIDIIIGLGMMNPFIAIINMILFYQKKSQEYMKGSVTVAKSDEMVI